jgi:hypothetical protein
MHTHTLSRMLSCIAITGSSSYYPMGTTSITHNCTHTHTLSAACFLSLLITGSSSYYPMGTASIAPTSMGGSPTPATSGRILGFSDAITKAGLMPIRVGYKMCVCVRSSACE